MKLPVQDKDFWSSLYARVQKADPKAQRGAYEMIKLRAKEMSCPNLDDLRQGIIGPGE